MEVFGHVVPGRYIRFGKDYLIVLAGERLFLEYNILKETGESSNAPLIYYNVCVFPRD